jgi:hypothetical protein
MKQKLIGYIRGNEMFDDLIFEHKTQEQEDREKFDDMWSKLNDDDAEAMFENWMHQKYDYE